MLHQKAQQGLLGLGTGVQTGTDGVVQQLPPGLGPDAAGEIVIEGGDGGLPAAQGAFIRLGLHGALIGQPEGLLVSGAEGLEFLGLVLWIRGPQFGTVGGGDGFFIVGGPNAQDRPVHSLQSFLFLSLHFIITHRWRKHKKKEPDRQALFHLKMSAASSTTRTMGMPVVSRK